MPQQQKSYSYSRSSALPLGFLHYNEYEVMQKYLDLLHSFIQEHSNSYLQVSSYIHGNLATDRQVYLTKHPQCYILFELQTLGYNLLFITYYPTGFGPSKSQQVFLLAVTTQQQTSPIIKVFNLLVPKISPYLETVFSSNILIDSWLIFRFSIRNATYILRVFKYQNCNWIINSVDVMSSQMSWHYI